MPNDQFFSYIMARTSYRYIWWDDDVCFVLDQHTYLLNFYSAKSLIQYSSFWYIILIPSQLVCVLSGEAANTNFIVFGFTRLGLELNDLPHSRQAR